MNEAQKRAASTLALAIVAVSALAVFSFAIEAFLGSLKGDEPAGRLFLRLAFDSQSMTLLLAPLGAILTAGLTVGATANLPRPYIYVTAALLTLCVISALVLWYAAGDDRLGPSMIQNWSREVSPDELEGAAGRLVATVVASCAGGLAALLGVRNVAGTK